MEEIRVGERSWGGGVERAERERGRERASRNILYRSL